jgi:hypothetical protein
MNHVCGDLPPIVQLQSRRMVLEGQQSELTHPGIAGYKILEDSGSYALGTCLDFNTVGKCPMPHCVPLFWFRSATGCWSPTNFDTT